MIYADIMDNVNRYARMIEEMCVADSRIVIYGTSEEAVSVLGLLQRKNIFLRILYIVSSTALDKQSILGIPVRNRLDENDERDCVVILDYMNSLLAKDVLLRKEKSHIVNVFEKEGFYDENILVSRQWMTTLRTDEELIRSHNENINTEVIAKFVRQADSHGGPIRAVEIETVNRCNGECSFCPVNIHSDTRKLQFMDHSLFVRIIDQLAEMDYSGKLALFSNNEPLLDKNIVEFHKYARQKIPKCRMHLFTNGTLLTVDRLKALIPYLDELIIDNYSDNMNISEHLKLVIAYCEEHPELIRKVTVVMRRQNERLSSRGGDATNRHSLPDVGCEKCALPFQQLVIRPNGKVSLCCNDPLGKYTLGDLNTQTIEQVWHGERFVHIRNELKKGREMLDKCSKCDAFHFYY